MPMRDNESGLPDPRPVQESEGARVIPLRPVKTTLPVGAHPAEETFERLFHRLFPAVLGYAQASLRDDDAAEDFAQQAFVRLWRRYFGTSLTAPKGKYDNLLFAMVTALVINDRRGEGNRKRRAEGFMRNALDRAAGWMDPEARIERRSLTSAYRDAVASLPPRVRQAQVLVRHQGMSYGQAAEAMGIARGTVHALLTTAGQRIEEFMTARGYAGDSQTEEFR